MSKKPSSSTPTTSRSQKGKTANRKDMEAKKDTKIELGDYFDEWEDFKKNHDLNTDADVSKELLDHYVSDTDSLDESADEDGEQGKENKDSPITNNTPLSDDIRNLSIGNTKPTLDDKGVKDSPTCSTCGIENCKTKGVVYLITCKVCDDDKKFIGETGRSLHTRFKEHIRSASFENKPFPYHYHTAVDHQGKKPEMTVEILEEEENSELRKKKKDEFIAKRDPKINADRSSQN